MWRAGTALICVVMRFRKTHGSATISISTPVKKPILIFYLTAPMANLAARVIMPTSVTGSSTTYGARATSSATRFYFARAYGDLYRGRLVNGGVGTLGL